MTQSHRVVIVDDSVDVRDGLRSLLATWPEITLAGEAANGCEAVQLVAECRPDFVLMDVRMPLMDGLQATQLIKQQWPDTRVIIHSLDASGQLIAEISGADGFLIKGSRPEELLNALGLRTVGSVRWAD